MAWVIRSSTSAKVSGIVVGCDGNLKLVGLFFEILGYIDEAGYIGALHQARAELGTWYGYGFSRGQCVCLVSEGLISASSLIYFQ